MESALRMDEREADLAARTEAALWDDLITESDAPRLSRFLRSCPAQLSDAFWSAHEAWLADEQRHFEAVFEVYRSAFGWDATRQERLEAAKTLLERTQDASAELSGQLGQAAHEVWEGALQQRLRREQAEALEARAAPP